MSRPRSWVHANCPFEHWIEARRRERSPPCSIVSHSSKEIPGTIIRNSSNVPASSIRRVGAAAHASSDSGGDTIVRIEVDGGALTLPPLAAGPPPPPGGRGLKNRLTTRNTRGDDTSAGGAHWQTHKNLPV